MNIPHTSHKLRNTVSCNICSLQLFSTHWIYTFIYTDYIVHNEHCVSRVRDATGKQPRRRSQRELPKKKTLILRVSHFSVYREYFMESAGVRYLRTSCWRIRNRTSERSERVRFLIQKQRVRKYRTKHFPCGIVFIIHILRHSSFWRPFYFKSFKNAKICRYSLTAKWHRKRSNQIFSKNVC